MSQFGMGVMIRMLGGNAETVAAYQQAMGRTIKSAAIVSDDCLRIEFADGAALDVRDEGQSCCESRYMRTDDELTAFAGARLDAIELREAPSITDDEYGEYHDCQFLDVKTDRGVFTCTNHIEHNGYYGGFSIELRLTDTPTPGTGE